MLENTEGDINQSMNNPENLARQTKQKHNTIHVCVGQQFLFIIRHQCTIHNATQFVLRYVHFLLQ